MTNERPPSPKVEEPEWARAIVIGATGSIPVAGSLLAAALDEVWVPRARERVQSFLQDVDQRLQALERKNDFSAERLRHDTDFLDYAREVVSQVLRSSDRTRLETLRNALINTALGRETATTRVERYRELVNRLTPMHIRVLAQLHNPPASIRGERVKPSEVDSDVARLICSNVPDLAKEAELVQVIVRELRNAGLLVFPDYVPAVLGPGQEEVYKMRSSRLSSLGLGFLRFVSDPEAPES